MSTPNQRARMLTTDCLTYVSSQRLETPFLNRRAFAVPWKIDKNCATIVQNREYREPSERIACSSMKKHDGGISALLNKCADLETVSSVSSHFQLCIDSIVRPID